MLGRIDDDISCSDSDSDDYSDDVVKISVFRENIEKYPLDYDSHFRLIKALKYDKKFEEAREARENMNKYYPLSSELWLEWIKDEKMNNMDKDYINKLFIRANNDYRSTDVWFEYCQFVIGYLNDKNEIRNIFEMALTQVGTQLPNAYLIWGTYILYENSILLNCESNQLEEANEQRKRIYELYLRQLSTPLQGNDDTYKEFLEWNVDNSIWEEEIRSKYNESKQLLKKYSTFEDKINNASIEYAAKIENESESKEGNWLIYLQYAEDNLSKCEIVNLYERSITDICLSQSIWVKYLKYLCKHFEKDEERITTAYKRAVRNYKSSLEIWLGFVRQMEVFNCPTEEIRKTFDSIFQQNLIDQSPFVPLWQAYLDFEKRQLDKQLKTNAVDGNVVLDLEKIRKLFQRLYEFENYIDYDPQCELIKYWAFVEAKYGSNLTKSRELWNEIIKSIGNNIASLWLEYLEFERKFGDFDHLKRIASNAVNCFPDYPQYLFGKILRIIAEDGDLVSYLQMEKKIDAQQKKINDCRLNEEAKKVEANIKNKKRKIPDSTSSDSKSKRVKFAHDKPEDVAKPIKHVEPISKTPVEKCSEKSVYVSNLNYRANENDLREKFEKCGKLADIRIVKDSAGKSRGFAYIQFENEKDVEEALKLERNLLMERPMFVTRNDPDKRHAFQFSVGVVENTKLFVKNLPKTVTKHALETIFGAFGTLKDVRIVTFKNGAPKGIAYIEFLNEDDASKALVGTDGMLIGDRTIEVFVSKPPPKGSSSGEEGSIDSSALPTHSFIVPRAVQKPMMTQKKLIHESRSADQDQDITIPKKSNDDFRKFLL